MKNNTLTKINIFFWNNINYYFDCFKKNHHDDVIKIYLNDYEKDSNDPDPDDNDKLLGVRPIIMNR
jgi:hypothetical protein